MYKILIKYTSTFKTIFWQSYMVKNENGEMVEFATDDYKVTLKKEIEKLSGEIGLDNIRLINDITYDVVVQVFDDIENVETVSSEDVGDIYSTAFNKVFG